MARRRFFVDSVHNSEAELLGEDAQHLTRVLRVEPGQRFEISDNQTAYLAEIMQARKDRVTFRILEPLDPVAPVAQITALVSLIKFDRFEWMIEKATELGVDRIIPVEAGRSEKGLLAGAPKRLDRWRRIARESSQQARRVRLPEIEPPIRLTSSLDRTEKYRYVLEEMSGAAPILRAVPEPSRRLPSDTVAVLIGPEGGWTGEERSPIAAKGWMPVSLGPRILRAETAALAALAILSNVWHDRNSSPNTIK